MTTLQSKEQQIAATSFGTVTDKRVMYRYKKSWISGGAQEDLPLRHLTSVRLEVYRKMLLGVLLVFFGFMGLIAASLGVKVIALLVLAIGVLFLWGSPRVVLHTAGGESRPATGWPWMRGEAQRFVAALQAELFKHTEA